MIDTQYPVGGALVVGGGAALWNAARHGKSAATTLAKTGEVRTVDNYHALARTMEAVDTSSKFKTVAASGEVIEGLQKVVSSSSGDIPVVKGYLREAAGPGKKTLVFGVIGIISAAAGIAMLAAKGCDEANKYLASNS